MAETHKIILLQDRESWGGFDPDLLTVLEITDEGMEELREGNADPHNLDDAHVLSEKTLTDAMRPEFVGWDHPRYEQWKFAVANDHTVLGLAAWIENTPEEES